MENTNLKRITWAVFTSFLGWVSVPLASAETNAWGNEAPIQNEAPAVDHSKTKKKKKKVATERNPAGERSKSVQPSAPTAVRPSQADKPVNESPEEDETRLTGNWGGARTKLSEIGLDFGLNYRADFVRLFKGGIAPQNAYLADIDFKTSFDFGKMVGWSGASAFFYMIHNHGSRPSESMDL